MKKINYIFILIIFSSIEIFAQIHQKTIEAIKTDRPPIIDGNINDVCWENAPVADNFLSFEPFNDGRAASQKTEVKVLYDNDAIYFAAMLFDASPDSILKEMVERDNGEGNTDIFSVTLLPFNDGINGMSFWVTASGVQIDLKVNKEDLDESWDAVWESEVTIIDNGWCAEIRIPYSALRFPKSKKQTWGINFWRSIRRYREWSTWQFIDKKKGLTTPQVGLLKELKEIKPPLRLSFSPYLSAYVENISDDKSWGYTYSGGMDIKYGLNESFTLDMTLIPDFGQVQSDDIILNLSPFETYYNEKRSFFTEGTELFQRCDIFYSRRIGNQPKHFETVENSLNVNEIVKKNPEETKLINATKLSGRTNKGLGIGVFNAMTSNTYAISEDTLTGETRNISTQPFTNYNMVVLDQSLKNNSYISLANTNVLMSHDNYCANVSGTEFGILNQKNSFGLYGTGIISQKYFTDSAKYGYSYELGFRKVSGNFTFEINRAVLSDKYDPNDMGFLEYNNEIENELIFSYNIFTPFWNILRSKNYFSINHYSLFYPSNFSYLSFSLSSMTLFKNYLSIFINTHTKPMEGNDFYESRTGRVFKTPPSRSFNFFYSPDYRKKFLIDMGFGVGNDDKLKNEKIKYSYNFTISPRFRVTDKMLINFKFNYSSSNVDYGFVGFGETPDTIFFGERKVKTITNTLTTGYIFNPKSSLSFRMRYYRSTADYDKFFELNREGYLDNTEYSGEHNVNFNAFTIDMIYKWQFFPGSEMSIVWKNSIYSQGNLIESNYMTNLKNTFDSPKINSLSIKILFYIDYQRIRKFL